MMKENMKYIPLVGLFYNGTPFIKNPTTEPGNFKSTLKYELHRLWKTFYHLVTITLLNLLILTLYFLLTH